MKKGCPTDRVGPRPRKRRVARRVGWTVTTPDASSGDARSRDDLQQAAVSGARWITLARIAAEVVLFATLVVLAHLIPPSAFGRYAIVVFMQELSVGVIGGFGQALVQRPTVDEGHQRAAMGIVLMIQAVLTVATWFVLAPLVFGPLFGHETAQMIKLASPAFLLA